MSSSGSNVPAPDPLQQSTQPLRADVLDSAPAPNDVAVDRAGLPMAQPAGQVAGYTPPPFANYNTAAVQVNNVIAAPQITLSLQQHKTPFILRAIWFICVGWWASGLAIALSFLMFYLVLTIPIGIWLLHRVPQIQTFGIVHESFKPISSTAMSLFARARSRSDRSGNGRFGSFSSGGGSHHFGLRSRGCLV